MEPDPEKPCSAQHPCVGGRPKHPVLQINSLLHLAAHNHDARVAAHGGQLSPTNSRDPTHEWPPCAAALSALSTFDLTFLPLSSCAAMAVAACWICSGRGWQGGSSKARHCLWFRQVRIVGEGHKGASPPCPLTACSRDSGSCTGPASSAAAAPPALAAARHTTATPRAPPRLLLASAGSCCNAGVFCRRPAARWASQGGLAGLGALSLVLPWATCAGFCSAPACISLRLQFGADRNEIWIIGRVRECR